MPRSLSLLKANDPDLDRLNKLLLQVESLLEREFLRGAINTRLNLDLAEIERLAADGRLSELAATLERTYASFANSVVGTMLASGTNAAEYISKLANELAIYDFAHPSVVEAAKANRLRLITGLNQSQRDAISQVIVDGISRGLNPREQARDIRQVIGLTNNQAAAVANYRKQLEQNSLQSLQRQLRDRRFDSTVRRASKENKVLSATQIDRMVERYSERMLAYRAEVIGRTEALRSVNQGNNQAFNQAFEDGLLIRSEMVRKWNTAHDERVRGSHAAMDGQTTEFGESFISGSGALLEYPGDPNAPASETIQCRCMASTRFK